MRSLIIILGPLLLGSALVTLLVHVESVTDQSQDIEAPGLVHPVNIIRLSIAIAVLVVILVAVVVSWLGLQLFFVSLIAASCQAILLPHLSGQEVEDEAEDTASQDDCGTIGGDGEVDW